MSLDKAKNKYLVLFSAFFINFLSGMIYMWSIISKNLVEDLHWTSSQASLPYTLFTIFFVVAMILMGRVQDSKGPRFVITLGVVLVGLGLLLSGLFISPMGLNVSMGMLCGLGVGMITVSSSPAAIKWFPDEKRGLITGIVVAGVGLSSVFYSPLASYTIQKYGLKMTFYIIGLIALIPNLFLCRNIGLPTKLSETSKQSDKNIITRQYNWVEMIKTKSFYKLWLVLAFISSSGLMIIGHISNIAHVQVGWEAGFVLVIILSVFNTLGRLFGGMISDKLGRVNLMKIIIIFQIVNMLFYKNYDTKFTLMLGTAVAGFCYGSSFSIFPATTADFYGMKNYGVNYGVMFSAWGTGGIIGPMVAAEIYDKFSNYNFAYITATILLIVAFIITFFIKKED